MIKIIVTDPTREEARQLTAYFYSLYDEMESPEITPAERVENNEPDFSEEYNNPLTNIVDELAVEAEATEELDAAQMPWDPTKHASSKAKTANGLWRARRNLGKEEYVDVPPPPPPAVDAIVPPPPVTMSFAEFVTILSNATTAGTITRDQINVAVANAGALSLPAVQDRLEMIPLILTALEL